MCKFAQSRLKGNKPARKERVLCITDTQPKFRIEDSTNGTSPSLFMAVQSGETWVQRLAVPHPDQDSEIALFGKRIKNVKEWAKISTFVFQYH